MKSDFFLEFPGAHMTQMNLRVSACTVSAFRQFCKEHTLTQNEALSILLAHASESKLAENAAMTEIRAPLNSAEPQTYCVDFIWPLYLSRNKFS